MKQSIAKIWLVAIVVTMAIATTSCRGSIEDKVQLEGYENLKINGLTSLSIDVEITNRSRRNIELHEVELTLKRQNKAIATLVAAEPLVIPKRSEKQSYKTTWRLRNVDALAALAATKEIAAKEPSAAFRLDVKATIKAGKLRHSIDQKNLRLDELIKLIDK